MNINRIKKVGCLMLVGALPLFILTKRMRNFHPQKLKNKIIIHEMLILKPSF